jgi:hypothetical protein
MERNGIGAYNEQNQGPSFGIKTYDLNQAIEQKSKKFSIISKGTLSHNESTTAPGKAFESQKSNTIKSKMTGWFKSMFYSKSQPVSSIRYPKYDLDYAILEKQQQLAKIRLYQLALHKLTKSSCPLLNQVLISNFIGCDLAVRNYLINAVRLELPFSAINLNEKCDLEMRKNFLRKSLNLRQSSQ